MKTSLGRLSLEKIKALTENSAIAQIQQTSKLYENSIMAQMQQASKLYENSVMAQMQQASKLYENSVMAQTSKLYENSAVIQASKALENSLLTQAARALENSAIAQAAARSIALTTPIKDLLNTQEFSSLKSLLHEAEIDVINFWKKQNTQYHLATLIGSHSSLSLLGESLSASTFENTQKEIYSIDIIEYTNNITDENLNYDNHEKPTQIYDESLFINTILLSIYILVIHAQVPLDQLLVTLAQNFLNSALFFYLQSKYEVAKNAPNSIDKNQFKNSRITTRNSFIYINPSLKSEIIEELEQYKFLEIIHAPELHKSWLKVRTEINDEVLEGYVLRSYTSPIK